MPGFDPSRPPQSSTSLVVRTDRPAINRWHSRLVVIHGVLAVVVLVLMMLIAAVLHDAVGGGAMAAMSQTPFAVMLVGQIAQIGYHCYLWGQRTAIEYPLVVSAEGLTFTTAQGIVALPWAAVESVSVQARAFGRIMIVRPQPGVQVDSPGVQICYRPSTWSKVVSRGLMLGERGLCEDLDQVVNAIVSASAGRVTVR